MAELPRVCVIGAGPSGLVAAKALADRAIPFACYEASDRVGGLWVFDAASNRSACYDHLHTNSSKGRTELRDFPMPPHFPDYPHHTQMATYFDAYAEHFGLRPRITFATAVRRAALQADGTWTVRLEPTAAAAGSGSWTEHFDALVVANGHHWSARWPEPTWPGPFDGEVIHAHDYRRAEQLAGRDVVVVGMGNSAMDIVGAAARRANRAVLSARRPTWVVPKYLLGRPTDQLPQDPRIPYQVRQRVFEQLLRAVVGPPERYGLPRPRHRIGEAHPTVSSELYDCLAHGLVTCKPGIARLDGDRVVFTDGTRVRADLIVCATGYDIRFPFLEPAVLDAPGNDVALYLNVFKPGLPSLAVLGLLQVVGSGIPLTEQQAKLVAAHLAGAYALPAPAEMTTAIGVYRRAQARRYVASARHTIQVDQEAYSRALDRELVVGARRAARRGNALPVPARVPAVA